jgi:ATPase family associated with various cellular activities (AAA)
MLTGRLHQIGTGPRKRAPVRVAAVSDDVLGPGDFGRALKQFLDASLRLAPAEEPALRRRLREHLGCELDGVQVASRDVALHELPNLQLALSDVLAQPGFAGEYVGVQSPYSQMSLGSIASPTPGYEYLAQPGPVEWLSVPLEPGRTLSCAVNAMLLVRGHRRPLAALVARNERVHPPGIKLEAISPEPEVAEEFLRDVAERMHRLNVYRGRIVTFSHNDHGGLELAIRELPDVARESIVLPAGVLERIERHALAPVEHRERLVAAGRHVKRGLLLHGPPGTGKTMMAMYLVGRMPGRTTVLLSGGLAGLVGAACTLARELEPATVILEDVDLFAHERDFGDPYGPILFQLLNEMDGLTADADVLFLLTTNRPDALEPALAARPGRIDQRIELPLPDAASRRRLIDVYGRGLDVRAQRLDPLVERLDGVSSAHVKELLRKAALLAAMESEGPLVVEDRHLEEAAADLI